MQNTTDLTDDKCLEFFLARIDVRFLSDTNADIGKVFIALAYPYVEVWEGPNWQSVDVKQPGLVMEPDSYPLAKFLIEYPHICRKIISISRELQEQLKALISQN